jgi:transposase
METALKIRRLCLVEGKSISEVARRFHLSRTTIRKYLKEDRPPAYRQSKPRSRPQLGDFESLLTQWLEQELSRPKRERRTAMRLFEDLQREGYTGAYDSVVRFVRAHRQSPAGPTDAYVPLSFDPGEAYQFDWSHEMVDLGGIAQMIKVAHFRLSYSRKPFVVAYHRESLEMVLDAHMRALAFFEGIPRKVIIDNPKTMVQAIGVGKGRQFNTRFLAMMNHYLIEPVACTPAAGWEKGQIENQVSSIRQWLFTPKPRFRDLAALNEWLYLRCEALGQRRHPVFKDRTIDEVYREEVARCRPPMACFDGYSEKILRVSTTCLVSYDRNRYSVPARYAGKLLTLRAYADRLVFIGDHEVVAEHPRWFTRDQSYFEPWHYLPILQRKPGALRNGAPFKDWELPQAMQRIRARYLKQPGGDRDFVELLLMAQQHDLATVNDACEQALAENTGQLSTIINLVHRLTDQPQPAPLNAANYPLITALPEANYRRYDTLVQGAAHAEPG